VKKAKIFTTIFFIAIGAASSLAAQTVHDEIALNRAQIEADRQTIVAATMGLSEADGKVFWPLYKDYRAEMDKPVNRAWGLLVNYGERWESLSDDDGAKLMNEWLGVEQSIVEVKQKWAKRMSKDLHAATVARFFQIDNKLDSIIRLEAAAEIPLVVHKAH
jgi:hypothetical protein